MDEYNKLYEMILGTELVTYEWKILRVPGGWIFRSKSNNNSSSVFVPFDNEFLK